MRPHSRQATRLIDGTNFGTDYVMHVKYTVDNPSKDVIDFNQIKLNHLIDLETNPMRALELIALLEGYCAGDIAISWCNGSIRSLPVTRE